MSRQEIAVFIRIVGPRLGAACLAALTFAVTGLTARGDGVEPITLWPMYERCVKSPCEYVGFSFPDPLAELPRQKADGGEIVGVNRIWMPVRDPDAPYGVGFRFRRNAVPRVAQRLRAKKTFRGLMVQFPTEFKTGSVELALYRDLGDDGQRLVLRRTFRNVPDEYQARLLFADQPPGTYDLRVKYVDGVVGVWTAPKTAAEEDLVYREDGHLQPHRYLEFAWLDSRGKWVWRSDPARHEHVRLGPWPTELDQIVAAGLKCMFWVGNWNNGAFPYYPDWFYTMFPDIVMRDNRDRVITAGILGKRKGWPSIDHPVIVDGTSRYIRAFVRRAASNPGVVYWVLGGETLYPTYILPEAGWADYSSNAQAHFRAWLQRRYSSVRDLNRAWGAEFANFGEVEPPRTRTVSRRFLDWIDYRFAAMAERMAWHYAAVREADPIRPALTCNHGNIFWGDAYAALGADFPRYADVSDGFEMGQIMEGDDPGCLNLWYAAALAGLGKIGAPARLAYRFPDPTARGGGRSYTPAAVRRYCLEAFGAGWWHLGLIQYAGSLPDGEWGVKDTPAEAEISRVWRDLKRLRPRAEDAWPILPKIGLYLSHAQWVQKDWNPDWTSFHVWAIQHQFDHAVLWEQQLLAGEGEQYPVILSIGNRFMDPRAVQGLTRCVERGAHLVILGPFAEKDPAGHDFPRRVREALLRRPRVVRIKGDVRAALGKLPDILADNGVRPFCHIESANNVSRRLALEPEHGRHDLAWDLAPRRTAGQSFPRPPGRIRHVAFRTPTFTGHPKGFSVILRLRVGGPDGEVLAENRLPAEKIRDNAWTGIDTDILPPRGQQLYFEICPDRPIPPRTLGVWANRASQARSGKAYTNGREQSWAFELQLVCEVRVPSRLATEAFTLFDGCNFLTPLINLADTEADLLVDLDPGILPENARPYSCIDALAGKRLGPGRGPHRVRVPAHGYRVLEFRGSADPSVVGRALGVSNRAVAALGRAGFDVAWAMTHLEQARRALDAGRTAKALGRLNRVSSAPFVRLNRCELQAGRGLAVQADVCRLDGTPFTGATGVLRLIPMQNAFARLQETSPGRYEGLLPSRELLAYDYARRKYRPYAGPLRAVVNFRKGRVLGQCTRVIERGRP